MLRPVLFILSSVVVTSSHALVYSSSLNFKVTDTRINSEHFNFVPVLKESSEEKALLEKLTAHAPADKKTPTSDTPRIPDAAAASLKLRGSIPSAHPHQARIFVVDEEALLNGQIKAVSQASVHMINPTFETGPRVLTTANGLARIPYPFTQSVRFFVRAQGYMMGMGYATFGNITLVPLVSEKRFSTLVRSLNLNVPAGQMAIMGRIVDPSMRGIQNVQVKFNSNNPRVVYSGPFFGGIPGYFTDEFVKTDSQGAFIANGLSRTTHSVQMLSNNEKIPAFNFDLSGIPESVRFVSIALQNGPTQTLAPAIVDADSYERPNCGLVASLSGHLIPGVPDEDGTTWLETKNRPVINDLVVNTEKCRGYYPTYLSQPTNELLFPPTIELFTSKQIRERLAILNRDWSPTETLVMGHVYPQKEFKHAPMSEVSVSVLSSLGEKVKAEILYFNQDDQLDPRRTTTDAHYQNFAILGLEEGEYHFVYRNGVRGAGLGLQVVRVKRGGITQVDF